VWQALTSHPLGIGLFAAGFLVAIVLSKIRLPQRRDINPLLKPRPRIKVEAEAAAAKVEKIKDQQTDEVIRNYEDARRRGPHLQREFENPVEDELRRIHQVETSKPFRTDMLCPECKAIAQAGYRVMQHNFGCSRTRELEPAPPPNDIAEKGA
jgi:hypothetical protein